jgi:hypothetical protein
MTITDLCRRGVSQSNGGSYIRLKMHTQLAKIAKKKINSGRMMRCLG